VITEVTPGVINPEGDVVGVSGPSVQLTPS
jgi:hypothetical protein